jgi:excisionase family DNA binding protein
MSRPGAHDRSSPRESTPVADLLVTALSERALAQLEQRIEVVVARLLRELLPAEIERAQLTPWLDTKQAATYLGVSENALRLRVREALVSAHRDGAGRLRFHRDELDQSMRSVPPRRRRR